MDPTRLGASVPEDGCRAGVRNVPFVKFLYDGRSPGKEIVSGRLGFLARSQNGLRVEISSLPLNCVVMIFGI